jgi:hypothetical protein
MRGRVACAIGTRRAYRSQKTHDLRFRPLGGGLEIVHPAGLDPAVKRTRRQSKRLDAGAACPQSHVGVPSDLFVAVGRANRHESLADPRCRGPARQKRRKGMAASPASDQSARTTPEITQCMSSRLARNKRAAPSFGALEAPRCCRPARSIE